MNNAYFKVYRNDDNSYTVSHNCNGSISFNSTEEVDERTGQLIKLAIIEGARSRCDELKALLGVKE